MGVMKKPRTALAVVTQHASGGIVDGDSKSYLASMTVEELKETIEHSDEQCRRRLSQYADRV